MTRTFVRDIDGGTVVVETNGDVDVQDLRVIGGRRELLNRRRWVIGATGEEELAVVLAALRDLGVAFAGGQGWPPAAQFARLCELGMLQGPYLEVVWRGPNQPETIRHE